MPDRIFKAKKYVVSKLSETKGGRSFILKHFGHAGVEIVEALKSSASEFKDAKTAKSLKLDLLKLVTKAVLLSKKTTLGEAREPTLACIQGIQEFLDGGPIPRERLVKAHDALLALLKKHVREHNWRRLTRLMEFYGSEEFLGKLPQKERQILRVAVAELVQPYEAEMKALTEFLIRSMKRQEATLTRLIESPRLEDFLKSDSDALIKWLPPHLTPYLAFLRAVDYFKTTENLRLRGPRARQIQATYFHLFDEDCDIKTTPPRDTFKKLEDIAFGKINVAFQADFTSSAAFAALKDQAASLQARARASQRHLAAKEMTIEDSDSDV